MNWFHRVHWGDAPTWIGGVGTALALVFAGVQLRLDRQQRKVDEQQRREEETQRRNDQKRSQLTAVQEATADLLGIAGYILTLASIYGIRRAAYERSWTTRPGRSVAATFYGPRLITELVAASERLLATYHRLKFSSSNEQFTNGQVVGVHRYRAALRCQGCSRSTSLRSRPWRASGVPCHGPPTASTSRQPHHPQAVPRWRRPHPRR